MRRPAAFSPDWWQERGLTAMLVSLVLALFVGRPCSWRSRLGQPPSTAFFGALLLSGVVAFSRRRMVAIACRGFGLVGLVLGGSSHGQVARILVTWDEALSLVMLLLLAGLVLEHVFRQGPITADRIRGAIAAYLLLGLVWCFAYNSSRTPRPGALNLGPVTPGQPQPADDRVLQLRHADDGRLRRHHPGPSFRAHTGDRRSSRRAALSRDPDRQARFAADHVAPRRRRVVVFRA